MENKSSVDELKAKEGENSSLMENKKSSSVDELKDEGEKFKNFLQQAKQITVYDIAKQFLASKLQDNVEEDEILEMMKFVIRTSLINFERLQRKDFVSPIKENANGTNPSTVPSLSQKKKKKHRVRVVIKK